MPTNALALKPARTLKQRGDDGVKEQGTFAYGAAKAEIDAVIAGLVVALAKDQAPASLPDLENRLQRSVNGRETFHAAVMPLMLGTSGERNMIGDLVTGALGPLIEAIKELYLDHHQSDQLTQVTRRGLPMPLYRHTPGPYASHNGRFAITRSA